MCYKNLSVCGTKCSLTVTDGLYVVMYALCCCRGLVFQERERTMLETDNVLEVFGCIW